MEKECDPWWEFSNTIDNFSKIFNKNAASSWKKVLNESIPA